MYFLSFFYELPQTQQKNTSLLFPYEAWVRFWIRVRVRVRDSAIFEKVGCGCGGVQRLKNY